MNHYNYEKMNDFIDLNETVLNHPHFVPRHRTNQDYGRNTHILQTFPKKKYAHAPKRQRKLQSFDRRRFPEETEIFSSSDWNRPLKTEPNPIRCTEDMHSSYTFPRNHRSEVKHQYFPPYKGKYEMDPYSSKQNFHYPDFRRNNLDFYGNHFYKQFASDQRPDFPIMQNYTHPNLPPTVWENGNFPRSNRRSYKQNAPFNEHCISTQDAIDCNMCGSTGTNAQAALFDTDLQKYCVQDESNMSITPSVMQINDSNNSPLPVVEFSCTTNEAALNEKILAKSTTEKDVSMELSSSLNSMDETALSVYHLQNLYPSSASENSIIDLNSNLQLIPLNNMGDNLLQEKSEDKDSDQTTNDIYIGNEVMNQSNESTSGYRTKLKMSAETNAEDIEKIQSSYKEINCKNFSASPEKADKSSELDKNTACNSFYIFKIKNNGLIFNDIKGISDLDKYIETDIEDTSFNTPEVVHIEQGMSSETLAGTLGNPFLKNFEKELNCDENTPVSLEMTSNSLIFSEDSEGKISQTSLLSFNNSQVSTQRTVNNLEESELDTTDNNFSEKTDVRGASTKSISHVSINMNEQNKIPSPGRFNGRETFDDTITGTLKRKSCPCVKESVMKSLCIARDKTMLEENFSHSSDFEQDSKSELCENSADISNGIDDNVKQNPAIQNLKLDWAKLISECSQVLDSEIPPNNIEASGIRIEDQMTEESVVSELQCGDLGTIVTPVCQVDSDIEANGLKIQHVRPKSKCKKRKKSKTWNSASDDNYSRVLHPEELLNPVENCWSSFTNNIFNEFTNIKYHDYMFELDSFGLSKESSVGTTDCSPSQKVVKKRKKSLKTVNYSIESTSLLDPLLESSGSSFSYSNILDSNSSLNQIETSLSSITNYALDETTNLKFDDEIIELDSLKRPTVNGMYSDKKSTYTRRSRASRQKKIKCHVQTTSSDPFLSSASVNNLDYYLLEDPFEPTSPDDVQKSNAGLGYSGKKRKRKFRERKSETSTIRKYAKPTSVRKRSDFCANEFLPHDNRDFTKMDALRQVLKEFYTSKVEQKDAFTQISEADLRPCVQDKCDAETQWNLSDVSWSDSTVKCELVDEDGESPKFATCGEEKQIRGDVEVQKENTGGEQKIYWNLRTRQTTSCPHGKQLDQDCLSIEGDKETSKPMKNLIIRLNPVKRGHKSHNQEVSSKGEKSKVKAETEVKSSESAKHTKRNMGASERRGKLVPQKSRCQNQRRNKSVEFEATISKKEFHKKFSNVRNTEISESKTRRYSLRKRMV